MESKSPFNFEHPVVFVFSIFYLVAAGALLVILALSSFAIVTVGFLGILSLLAAYGLFKLKKWAVWLVVALFFPEITFSLSTLYSLIAMGTFYASTADLLLNLSLIFYALFCFVSLVYVVAKREIFQ